MLAFGCPKCGVGLPYNPTYKTEGLCSTCRTYQGRDRLLGDYRLKKQEYNRVKRGQYPGVLH